MRSASIFRPEIVLLWALFLVPTIVQATETANSPVEMVSPEFLLRVGPMPAVPAGDDGIFPRGTIMAVPEIPPTGTRPQEGDQISLTPGETLTWRKVVAPTARAGDDGPAYWWTSAFSLTIGSSVAFTIPGATILFVDGEEWNLGETEDGIPTADSTLMAGTYTLLYRAPAAETMTATATPGALTFTLDPRWPLTRFDQLAGLQRFHGLAISDDGKVLARKVSRREPGLSRLDLMNAKGKLVASDLGGAGAAPVAFLPGRNHLLLKRSGKEGTDLLLWTGTDQPLRTVLRDEPGLGAVRISPDGRYLLFVSNRAFESAEPVSGPRRYAHLRERLNDFTPVPHLHLMELATGARRVLTVPGDRVLDDAIFGPKGHRVYYTQTRHQIERPWFHSEIHRLDLRTGQDTELTRFTGGWEVRPQGLAVHPDGKTLTFLGPPEEVGGGRKEHNVYNKQLYSLDLASGTFTRRTKGLILGFDVGGGLPRFDTKGRLLLEAVQGRSKVLARVDPARDWAVEVLPMASGRIGSECLGSLAVSPNGNHLLYTASEFDALANLFVARTGHQGQLIENNQDDGHFLWGTPEDASFVNSDGTRVDAWFYPPLQHDGDWSFGVPTKGKAPLVVYYYAGTTPTLSGFNGTHQFFAAHGYGVLVVNPRGCYGYGDDYADFHAGDWGPAAGSDIIEGTKNILMKHRWLDEDGIGIYGGSYGGFMTEYLVTATDIFDAAVSLYGISDLATYWGQGTWGWTYGDMALGGRLPWSDSQYFFDHSPLFRADRVNTPLLLLHGQDDANVTPGESEQLFTALSVLDRPVEMVLFPGEDHGISGSWENRVGHRTMILEWFDKYCRNRPEAWQERWQ